MTPEKTIQLQVAYDSDVVICLDDCTHVDAPLAAQRESVHARSHGVSAARLNFKN